MVGLSRFELLTPRLSSVCSNQLSYRPFSSPYSTEFSKNQVSPVPSKLDRNVHNQTQLVTDRSRICLLPFAAKPCGASAHFGETSSRKEVIQPQVLLQLPCYDFTPITKFTIET